jgi:transcriptional regulator with XRE-family HTH domain
MITVQQIKAARSLLDWRQEDLAQRSGISLAAINKLEREIVSPRTFTMETLQQTFEQQGVEFIEGPGVRLTHDIFRMKILEGDKAPGQLLDDIFETLREESNPSRQEMLLSGLDERQWEPYADAVAQHQARLNEHNIGWRALICEGDTELLPYLEKPETIYRWISKELFTQMLYYVYGDKYAMVIFEKPVRVIIIESKIVAETYRKQFEMNWKNAKEVAV